MSENKGKEDRFLLFGLRDGDEEAFRILFDKYAKRLYGIARQYLGDPQECEEIVQEVFFKVWVNRRTIQPDLPFVSYIARIARNLIVNQAKHRLIQQAYLNSLESSGQRPNTQTEHHVIFAEIKLLVEKLVAGFPPKRKEIFILSRFQGLTNREIANRMQISERTVEGQINKALKILRQQLKMHGYLAGFLFLTSSIAPI